MGFFVQDLGDKRRFLHVNFWNWRPTIELIRSFQILDDQRVEMLGVNCVGDSVSAEEARQIGERLRDEVLPRLLPDQRIKLNLSITSEMDDGKMYYGEEAEKNYSAHYLWLQQFSSFCFQCQGFRAS